MRTATRSIALCVAMTVGIVTCVARADDQTGPSGTWTNHTASAAGSREQSSAIYDPVNNRMIVFGGAEAKFDGWSADLNGNPVWEPTNTGPAGRKAMSAVYDPVRRRLIVFGGYSNNYLNDVWAMALEGPQVWTQITPAGTPPSGRMFSGMAYDPIGDRLVIFGGHPVYLNDVWTLNLSGTPIWTQITITGAAPAPRYAHSFVYDPPNDRFLVFGGTTGAVQNDVWALRLGATPSWTFLATADPPPSPRAGMSSFYDPTDRRMIVFGGTGSFGLTNDVWSLSLHGDLRWTLLSTTGGPPPGRAYACAVLQPTVPRLVVYGGLTGAGTANDVWSMNWTPDSGAPEISSFSPLGGPEGTPVVINGRHLDGATQVLFNGVEATIQSSTEPQIMTMVPPGATTGPVEVFTALGHATSATPFIVGEPPVVDSAVPDSGRVGTTVTISGRHFLLATSVSFGANSDATFTATSDSTIEAVVDAGATSGPIVVTSPTGSGQSSFSFDVLPPRTRPFMVGVRDVANDQGGFVTVRWLASDLDGPSHLATSYRVWRRAPLDGASDALRARSVRLTALRGADTWFWEDVGVVAAAGLPGYAATVATPQDSLPGSNPFTAFVVQTLTANPAVFYFSGIDSGYSVDNLAPAQPPVFVAIYARSSVALHWTKSPEPDFFEYRLYRGPTLSFVPDASHLVMASGDTGYVDTSAQGPNSCYKLAAVDVHGNVGRSAVVSPSAPTSILASVVLVDASRERVRLRWHSAGYAGRTANVHRWERATGWHQVGAVAADGSDFMDYEDADVVPGQRYGYRVGILDGPWEAVAGEVWVEIPGSRLALQSVEPNPAGVGFVSVTFSLASDAPASLELLDLAGRLVSRRDVSEQGSGSFEYPIRQEMAAGVYVLRLRQGSDLVTRKLVVIR